MALHHYELEVEWTGNTGQGTTSYRSYKRDYTISHALKTSILGSSDPAYLGDSQRWNPEELIVAAAAACHQLWYLHLCADHKIVVLNYLDQAKGSMQDDDPARGGHITEVILSPKIKLAYGSNLELAKALHHQAHAQCMIANSVKFPILCEPHFEIDENTENSYE